MQLDHPIEQFISYFVQRPHSAQPSFARDYYTTIRVLKIILRKKKKYFEKPDARKSHSFKIHD